MIIGVLFEIIELVFLEVQYNRSSEENKEAVYSVSCRSPIWLSASVFEFFTVLVFICLVIKLSSQNNALIQA